MADRRGDRDTTHNVASPNGHAPPLWRLGVFARAVLVVLAPAASLMIMDCPPAAADDRVEDSSGIRENSESVSSRRKSSPAADKMK
ncbi:MAG TPA: hypothetical protein VND64_22515, partial [Pirellulales bacterium]|nr:hypothetical protein [Pirellulales bacterium]